MKRQRMMLAAMAVVALLFLLTQGAPLASADTTFVSIIDRGNSALTGLATPFATVTITVNVSGVATVDFQANNGYFLGDGSTADLNLTQSGITASNFSWTGGDTKTAFTSAGSGNVSGFGVFNLTVNNFDGRSSAVSDLQFTLSGTWANASSVLTMNAKGFDAASHIYAPGVTGFAGEGNGVVPDGGVTLMLLGGALVGLATLRRRFTV
jgi:hypothetical protein